MIYTFICDPDKCDAMIIFHAQNEYGFPKGEIKMKCPCGRKMQYISMTESAA